MRNMDFEKEYKDMVQRARELHESGNALTKLQMEIVCPALAESEDERIREGFRRLLNGIRRDGGLTLNKVPLDKCFAYLERQKEQKSAEWSDEDELYQHNIIAYLKFRKDKNLPEDTKYPVLDAWIDWLKSLRPQPHWKPSDEQMFYLSKAIMTLGDEGDCKTASILKEIRDDIKKLM